jgi:small-conductance mechanosensitive channel
VQQLRQQHRLRLSRQDAMNETTRGAVRLLLGAWYIAGAVLLVELLVKGDADGLAARTGGSALAIVALGFAVGAGVRLAERPTNAGLFGWLTVLISSATFFLLAVEIWSEHPWAEVARTLVMVVISLLLGMISLLLDAERDEDEGPLRLARGIASLALVALGVLVVLGACGVDIGPRLAGIAAALFVFPTLSLPVLRLVSSERQL